MLFQLFLHYSYSYDPYEHEEVALVSSCLTLSQTNNLGTLTLCRWMNICNWCSKDRCSHIALVDYMFVKMPMAFYALIFATFMSLVTVNHCQ